MNSKTGTNIQTFNSNIFLSSISPKDLCLAEDIAALEFYLELKEIFRILDHNQQRGD